MRFHDKIVLLTGAATGLGRAASELLASEGARLFLVDRAAEALHSLVASLSANGCQAQGIVGDASHQDTVDAALTAAMRPTGRIDILINNAGINPTGTIVDTDAAQWASTIDVNLKSAYLFSHSVIPLMVKQGGGVIVNTASIAGQRASTAEAAYAVSKAAMIMLSRTTARDFAGHGIRCNALCPGVLETVMADRRTRMSAEDVAKRSAKAAALVPMGRLGRYDEVAKCLAFLASDDASYVNGAQLTVDGALTA